MPSYEYINIRELDGRDSEAVGHRLHAMVADYGIRRLLKERNLHGVVRRHTVSPEQSIAHIHALQRTAAKQKLAAFVIVDTTGDIGAGNLYEDTVGMATLQEDLPLHQHHLPGVPAALARKAGLINKIDTPATNAAAWFGHDNHLEQLREDIAHAYGFLHLQAPNSWTLGTDLQSVDISSDYRNGLEDAYYWPVTATGRYDDGEARWQPAPQGRLFVAHQDILA